MMILRGIHNNNNNNNNNVPINLTLEGIVRVVRLLLRKAPSPYDNDDNSNDDTIIAK